MNHNVWTFSFLQFWISSVSFYGTSSCKKIFWSQGILERETMGSSNYFVRSDQSSTTFYIAIMIDNSNLPWNLFWFSISTKKDSQWNVISYKFPVDIMMRKSNGWYVWLCFTVKFTVVLKIEDRNFGKIRSFFFLKCSKSLLVATLAT